MQANWPREIEQRFAKYQAKPWRNDWLQEKANGAEILPRGIFEEIASRLEAEGAFKIRTEEAKLPAGEEIVYTRAAETGVWPMGTHVWIRDLSLIADRTLRAAAASPSFSEYKSVGKQLLLAALTLMSTPAQLKRFEDIIGKRKDAAKASGWPQIFLDSRDNLTGEKVEAWSHKQDAWQMTAYLTARAIKDGLLNRTDLRPEQEEFLRLAPLFLEAANYARNKSSGSWEEVEEVRASVLAWEVALLEELGGPGKEKGSQALQLLWPNETETRAADAALVYLLQLKSAARIFAPEQVLKKEAEILKQLSYLDDAATGGMYRYLGDSYQRQNFFRPDVARRLTEYYGSTSGEASGEADFAAREKIVPPGRQAAWVHPVWQMSAWAGRRYLETGDGAARQQQHDYFIRGLGLITGEDEATVEPNERGEVAVKEIPAWRLPECYITLGFGRREVILPSPHTPLNWAVAEAIDAFVVMEQTFK